MGELNNNSKLYEKKYILFIYLICVLGIPKISFSQEANSQNTFSSKQFYDNAKQKITAPNAAAFVQTKLMSVNNNSGSASISVPIYEISQGGVNIPIRLNYISTGVKVNDVASNVGLNWSLEAGGSITKIIKGNEDFAVNFFGAYRDLFPNESIRDRNIECGGNFTICQNERKVKYDDFVRPQETLHKSGISSLGWFLNTQALSVKSFFDYQSSYPDKIYSVDYLNNKAESGGQSTYIKQDVYPDLFYVNAPGLNTKFTHKKDITKTNPFEPFEIEYQGNQITTTVGKTKNEIPFLDVFYNKDLHDYTKTFYGSKARRLTCINNIDITNNNGIKYTFNVLDINQHASRGASLGTGPLDELNTTSQEVTNYHLGSVEDVNGDLIEFEYETYQTAKRLYSKSQNFGIKKDEQFYALGLPNVTEVYYPQLNRIKKITFKRGTVNFVYSKNRSDLPGDKALTYVIIKDNFGRVIKKHKLRYDYFVANTNCNEPKCLRLKLESVTQESPEGRDLPSYDFFYDETQLPEFGATTVDYLGYANGVKDNYDLDRQTTTYVAPFSLYYKYNKGRFSFSPVKIFSGSYKTIGRNGAPYFKYTKAGTLLRIKRPTGANQFFDYELNSFSSPQNKDITAAGLRLRKQTIKDEKGHVKLLEKYSYKDEEGYSSGVINNLPLFGDVRVHESFLGGGVEEGIRNGKLDFRLYSSSKNEVKFIGGNNVGYSRVIVKNGINNGTIERRYTTVNEFPIEEPTLVESPRFGSRPDAEVLRSFDNGGHFPFFNNNDVKLGKLTLERIKDFNNETVKETIYTYDYETIDTMEQEVEIFKSQLVNNGSPGDDYGMIFLPKIYSHRNLQTDIVDKTFFGTKKIENVSKMSYDPIYPIVKESSTKLEGEEEIVTKNYYPLDVINNRSLEKRVLTSDEMNAIELLKTKKRILSPIQTETYRNDNLLATQRINYKNWGSGILAPETVEVAKNADALKIGVKQKYDVDGNLVEIRRNNGSYMVYIYGYNNTLPVAEISGAQLTDIPTSHITRIKTLSNQDNDRTIDTVDSKGVVLNSNGKEGKLREELYKLYDLATLSKAVIKIYTHDPLIGLTSVTDARKQTMYYDYDTFNRLQFVKDQNGNVITQYCYNYKGEKRKCNEENIEAEDDNVFEDIESTTEEVAITVGPLTEYLIPIPTSPIKTGDPFPTRYEWDEMKDGVPYPRGEKESVHPFFYTPAPPSYAHHPGDFEPSPLEELDLSFYTLTDFLSRGRGYYKITYRKGYSFSIKDIGNLKNISDCKGIPLSEGRAIPETDCGVPNERNSIENLRFSWFIVSEGKQHLLITTDEIKTVFFVPECLDGKLGKLMCRIYRKEGTREVLYQTLVSNKIPLVTGFETYDKKSMCGLPLEEAQ